MTDMKLQQIIVIGTNPRRSKPEGDRFKEFKDSILTHGILEPLIVREVKGQPNNFELVCGGRRLKAAQELKLATVPVIIKELNDTQVLEIQIVENVQRDDLTPLEEARGYKALIDRCKLKQADIAEKIAKSQGYIAARLALLDLRPDFQARLEEGKLTPGHAKYLMILAGCEGLLDRVAKKLKEYKDPLTVREFEDIVDQVVSDSSRHLRKSAYGRTNPEFDTKGCKACKFNRPVKTWNGMEPRCFDLACWSKKQTAAKKVTSERIREKIKSGKVVTDIPKECKQFEQARFNKTGCKKCAHRKVALAPDYSGKTVKKEVCLDPACFAKKEEAHKADEEKKQRENRVKRIELLKAKVAKMKIDRAFWAELLYDKIDDSYGNAKEVMIIAYDLELAQLKTKKAGIEYFTRKVALPLEQMFVFVTLWED